MHLISTELDFCLLCVCYLSLEFFLMQLMRAREAALWELEERQIHEKQQLAKRQLKDIFFLQRHQVKLWVAWSEVEYLM